MIYRPQTDHGERKRGTFGLMVHTTGDKLGRRWHERQASHSRDGWREVVDAYSGKLGPHYAICPDGMLVVLRKHTRVAYHCGVSAAERQDFLTGRWEDVALPRVLRWWRGRWPGYKSPQHLYPSRSPNQDYIGVEMVPAGGYVGRTWTYDAKVPRCGMTRYTVRQMGVLAKLALELAESNRWPGGWENGPRLVGHEDINPITRPGWDPGDMIGGFSWSTLRDYIEAYRGLRAVTIDGSILARERILADEYKKGLEGPRKD